MVRWKERALAAEKRLRQLEGRAVIIDPKMLTFDLEKWNYLFDMKDNRLTVALKEAT